MRTELPLSWCIKLNGPSQDYPELYKWRTENKHLVGSSWLNSGYIHSDGWHLNKPKLGYEEITYEEFLILVLGNKSTVESYEIF